MSHASWDARARVLSTAFPAGPRVIVLGGTRFHHGQSEETCRLLGAELAGVTDLVLLTGGVPGVGETVGRSYFGAARGAGIVPKLFHILPQGCGSWDYGETWFAGGNMEERREILGRLARWYVAIEGGPGTRHEIDVAVAHGARVIPVGRLGGAARDYYVRTPCPSDVDASSWDKGAWEKLGDFRSSPAECSHIVCEALRRMINAAD